MKPQAACLAVRRVLSDDLLKPKVRASKQPGDPKTFGHCYVAAEVCFHLCGGKEAGLRAVVSRYGTETHWYLLDARNRVIDPTATQFTQSPRYAEDFLVNTVYRAGRPTGFLTAKPSKRAAEVLRRIKAL